MPATFRAHSIDSFNKGGTSGEFLLRWVGRQGREITTPPADPEMARTIEAFAAEKDPKPASVLSTIDGRLVFRTVYPSLAREQSCVSCHNQLQQGMPQWQLNDVMGAFAIDIPVAAFLQDLRKQSYQLGLGLLRCWPRWDWRSRFCISARRASGKPRPPSCARRTCGSTLR